MKKIFTLLAAALMSLTVSAENYNCKLAVEVFGEPAYKDGAKVELSCEKNANGKYDIQLKDFYFDKMAVGDINIKDIEATDKEGATMLSFNGTITLGGAFEGVALPTTLEGVIVGETIGVRLDIPVAGVKVVAQNIKTQMPGSDFEGWHKATKDADEPNGWHTLMSGTGALLALAAQPCVSPSDDVREGATGTSARINSFLALGVISANGTITTGRMNADGFSATDPKNNAYNYFGEDVDGNGNPFNCALNGNPTSISFWYKFKNGGENTNPAMVCANLTGEGYFQDPMDKEYDNLVATAKSELAATDEWKQVTVPFVYEENNMEDPAYILTTINTCSVPGGGSMVADDPDVLYVDDLTLNYEPVVKGISIFEKEVEGFSADKDTYDITVGAVPTDEDIEFDCGYEDAAALTYYDANTKTLTVNVYNAELKYTGKTYTFNVTVDPTGIDGIATGSNHVVTGRYSVNGQKVGKNARGLIITKYADGTVVKTFKK